MDKSLNPAMATAESAHMTFTHTNDRQAWAADVAADLAALTERQSAVLRLLYFEHLTGHEVAARVDVTVEDVWSAAATGMRRLGDPLTNA